MLRIAIGIAVDTATISVATLNARIPPDSASGTVPVEIALVVLEVR